MAEVNPGRAAAEKDVENLVETIFVSHGTLNPYIDESQRKNLKVQRDTESSKDCDNNSTIKVSEKLSDGL